MDNIEHIKKERAKRIKTVRSMAGLSRKVLGEIIGYSDSAIKSWETPKAGGLTTKGAFKVAEAIRKYGVYCSSEWLLNGYGEPPYLTTTPNKEPRKGSAPDVNTPSQLRTIIDREIEVFTTLNVNATCATIDDDGMLPTLYAGDIVCGIKKHGAEIEECIDEVCIVKTTGAKVYVRKLLSGDKIGTYTLICTNAETSKQFILHNIELEFAAPVVWHRRTNVF